MSNMFEIKKITDEDHIVKALRYFAPYLFDQRNNNEQKLDELSQKFYQSGNVIVVNKNQEAIGICAYYANDLKSLCGYISVIIVMPNYQGCGIGSLMMNYVKQDCIVRGMKQIRLEVMDLNMRAIRFYESHGFYLCEAKTDYSSVYSIDL